MLETTPKPAEVEAPPAPVEPLAEVPPPAEERTGLRCVACGAALEPDQECCVECGELAPRRRRLVPAGWPLRTGLASTTALLLSGFVGLGASIAFQGGGNVPRQLASHPSHPVIPPGIVPGTTTPAPGTPVHPAPGAATPSVARPTTSTPRATPTTPSAGGTGTPSTTTPTGRSSSPSTGGTTPTHHSSQSSNPTPAPAPTPAQPASGGQNPFPNGFPPDGAGVAGHGSTKGRPSNVSDQDIKTTWSTTSSDIGLWLDAGHSSSVSKLGIYSAGDGGTIQVYASSSNAPPSSPNGMTPVGSQTLLKRGKNFVKVDTTARYLLIWITSGPVSIAETSIIP